MTAMAECAFISRNTLARVERGDAGVSIGIYALVRSFGYRSQRGTPNSQNPPFAHQQRMAFEDSTSGVAGRNGIEFADR